MKFSFYFLLSLVLLLYFYIFGNFIIIDEEFILSIGLLLAYITIYSNFNKIMNKDSQKRKNEYFFSFLKYKIIVFEELKRLIKNFYIFYYLIEMANIYINVVNIYILNKTVVIGNLFKKFRNIFFRYFLENYLTSNFFINKYMILEYFNLIKLIFIHLLRII